MEKIPRGEKKIQEEAYKQSQLKLYSYMIAESFLDCMESRIIRESFILRVSSE